MDTAEWRGRKFFFGGRAMRCAGKSGDNAIRSLGGKQTYVRLRCFVSLAAGAYDEWTWTDGWMDGCTLSSVLDGSMMACLVVVHGAFSSESWSAVHNCSVSALSTPFRSPLSRVWAFHAAVGEEYTVID